MRCKEIMDAIEQAFPPIYAEEWDNVGLLVGHREQEITKVFLALDATAEVVEEAIGWGAQMLITHHPMIFKGMKRINDGDFIGKKILRLAENHIAYYAMHTNFDVMGMAEALADKLQIARQEVLWEVQGAKGIAGADSQQGIGRIGSLKEPMTLLQCAEFVKQTLQLPFVTVSGAGDTLVSRAAVSSGSGKSSIPYALEKGAQVLITGDIGHHEALDAKEQNLCMIDAGHYGTEKLFVEFMDQWFQKQFPTIVCGRTTQSAPFWVV